jgi:hypothetical protein
MARRGTRGFVEPGARRVAVDLPAAFQPTVMIDVVDDARSGIECGKGVIVEQRITEGGRPHAC